MHILAILLLALAPGLFWLWIAYRWDRYQPEPRWLVIRTFLLGMAVVLPVAVIETLMGFGGPKPSDSASVSIGNIAYEAFIIAGFTEELAKFLVVYFSIYRNRRFDESTDGIVYAAAAALGFATLENLFYMVSFGWQVIALRSVLSTFAHVLFAVMWGYPLALRKLMRPGSSGLLILGLIGSMAAHGLYDFVLFSESLLALTVIPIMIVMIVILILMLRHSRKISTFRIKPEEPGPVCPNCSSNITANAIFCTRCGAKIAVLTAEAVLTCRNCGAPAKPGTAFCIRCGNKLA